MLFSSNLRKTRRRTRRKLEKMVPRKTSLKKNRVERGRLIRIFMI
jgi:hypothetical protein